MKKFAVAAIASALVSFSAVAADAPSYDFLSGSYINFDDSGSLDGFAVTYSRSFANGFFGEADYLRVSDGVTLERGDLQLGYAHTLNEQFDFVATAGLSREEISVSGFSVSDNGFIGTAGVRSRVNEQIEAGAAVLYYNYDESYVNFRLSGRYFFNEKWSAEASYTFGDDNADSFRLGVAFHF